MINLNLNKFDKPHKQIQKGSGYVEHDANEILKMFFSS